ncbi:MAG: PQQ-binding-like beta-propeller repeat protein [Byssovorax sp.]
MSQLTAATCARCGAPLHLDPSAPKQVCSFCGNEHFFNTTTPPQAAPAAQPAYAPPPRPFVPPPSPTSPAVNASPVVFVAAGVMMLALVGGIAAASLAGRGRGSSSAMPGGGGIVPSGERLQWSSNGVNVIPARIDGDAVEDFVGRYVILDLSGQTTQTVFVGGFSGATFERVWKAGPYGNLSEAAGATHFTVAGDRVAVADYRSTLHVLDVTTGKELRSVRLSDRARSVCGPLDARKQVWVELADQNHQIIDLETGKSEAAARPAWCRSSAGGAHSCGGARAACADQGYSEPKQGAVRIDLMFTEGSTTVATGHKEPGTPTPMALGYDPKKKAATWTTIIPSDPASFSGMDRGAGDLAGGRFFTSYELAVMKGSRLVSFDAKTGARLWDVPVIRSESGSGVDGLAATPTRVYVPHWTWLDIHDAASGKLLGTVGMW